MAPGLCFNLKLIQYARSLKQTSVRLRALLLVRSGLGGTDHLSSELRLRALGNMYFALVSPQTYKL
jgi:hypothetical protein